MSTVRDVVALARERNLTFLAAGIAYYAFVSILPLLLLGLALASVVGGDALAASVTSLFSQQLTAAGQETVARLLTTTSGRSGASLVGLLVLTWSGLKLLRGLEHAVEELYPRGVDTSLVERVVDGLIVLVGVGVTVGLVVAVSVLLSALPVDVPFANLLGTVGLLAGLTLAFLPIYYVLPPVDVSVTEALPGAAVAAGGWVLLQIGFRIYAAYAARYAAYGLIGAILLFVTWLYVASIVVLLGAAVNAVLR